MSVSYARSEVEDWDLENVAAYLKVLGVSDGVVDAFQEHDVNGSVLVDLTAELLEEMNLPDDDKAKLLQGLSQLNDSAPATPSGEAYVSDDDEDDSAAAAADPVPPMPTSGSSASLKKGKTRVDKKNDPLRVAARAKAVADLKQSAVTTGWLYKTGGGGFRKGWKRRYFVLTDDNCLYYFKSPKEMSALGMILLPSYTVTKADKSESNKNFSFKVFNRNFSNARSYLFAAEDEREMKTWMNVMSLASIAFGTGRASMAKADGQPKALTSDNDSELQLMQERAQARAGGVSGEGDSANPLSRVTMPDFLKRSKGGAKSKGPTLVLVKMLDGETLQLYAESSTTGQTFLDQICSMLNIHEKYYFGLHYFDAKNDSVWLDVKKKFLKQDIPRKEDHYELEFRIRFFPVDVTHVLQYVTLYQSFLASRQAVLRGELEVTNKDAFILASFALQATRGDYDPAVHTPLELAKDPLIPEANEDDIVKTSNLDTSNLATFWAEEVIRVWKSLQGILRHLAVLKYMQVVQKHPQFAMQRHDIKNKNGTPLILGVSPKGLYVFRLNNLLQAVVTFSWAECAELAFADKKFTICVHDRATRDFSVYFHRSKTCQRVLDMCVGLHALYVQAVQGWENPPAEWKQLRDQAVRAALEEREKLKKEALEARARAKERLAKQPKPAAAAAPEVAEPVAVEPVEAAAAEEEEALPAEAEVLESSEGEQVHIKGRQEAVAMLDMMMNDPDFMRFQEEIMEDFENEMMEELEQGGRLRSASFAQGRRKPVKTEQVQVCDSEVLTERVSYMEDINNE
eukprot:m.235406 g.235406  ORF g.235406 m.235406 type:complete len:797 (+) comp17403_c0_seq2:184-2574(+)